jgi:hypothetical protein
MTPVSAQMIVNMRFVIAFFSPSAGKIGDSRSLRIKKISETVTPNAEADQ